jgi:hypothetical protein
MQTWQKTQTGAPLFAEPGKSRRWYSHDVTWGRPIFRAPELPSARPARYELAAGQQFFGPAGHKVASV